MKPGIIEGANAVLGEPVDWKADERGSCDALHVYKDTDSENGMTRYISQWEPSEEERAAILEGAPVYLCVWGRSHPVVSLWAMPRVRVGERA